MGHGNSKLETNRVISADSQDEVLRRFYVFLGFGENSEYKIPPNVSKNQLGVIRDLTADPVAGLAKLSWATEQANRFEPAWDILDPDKRAEVARGEDDLLALYFGHIAMAPGQQLPIS